LKDGKTKMTGGNRIANVSLLIPESQL